MREGGSGKGERGKRKESNRVKEREGEREGDSRDWMIMFQLWCAAVEGSGG